MTSPNVQPSPDITAYVDLRIFDVSDQDIVNTGLAAAQLNLPGWVPREGNTEVVLMESLALEISEAVVAINRVPGAVVAALLLLAGVDKDYGAAPVATATFTLGDTLGHTIPGGTRLYLVLDDGTTVTFLVEPPGLTVAPGSDTGTVSIIGDIFTDQANGIVAGTRLVMVDPVPFIEHVELATDVADGRSAETDNEWRDRGVARLSRLSDALVLPRHFEAAALERSEVARAVALDLWDGSGGAPGDDPGHITVAVLGDGGAALSGAAKTAIEDDLEARAVAILDVHVIDVTIVTVPFAVQFHPLPGYDSATLIQAVKDAINAYVDPLTWQWGGTIRRFEIVSLVDRVDGVDYVMTVTINGVASDYVISGAASLPDAGVLTVTTG
ncbi:baseplate J/gp47 family protein [Actinophytocola sp.]|uniref:baseplate J/gp47 family protein n=1 Tax=Actinophytocola sp. TaxID=1872138 RepID=UPI002D7FA389|nr:baseplate J/gp47 family protein [Actinophytocola sp.]HET9144145.1 baseplate J/gp47 family protein [Actinophytocola sp.]